MYNYENADNIEEVLFWRPPEKQWWITGFNPDYVGNVDVSKEILIGCVDFTGHEDMYNAFFNTSAEDNDNYNPATSHYCLFDDENQTVWFMWYGDA